ncbi:MAG: ABC transporter permease [Sandaracinaceae bacterium]
MRERLAMLAAVVQKEVRQTVRDRRMMALLVAAPLIQLFVFGHAVNFDVDRVPAVLVDQDQSHTSREDLRRLMADGTLVRVAERATAAEAEELLDHGEAAVAVVIPTDFERDLVRGRPTTVQLLLDGSDPNRANVASAAVSSYFAGRSVALMRERLARRGVRMPAGARAERRVYFNPTLESAVYMVPGVMAMLLLLITTIVSSMGLARERESGTLEQILVTPVSSGVLLIGKMLPFAVIGLVDFGIAMVVGSYVFDMPIRGSLLLLSFATLLYLATTLGMGLLIATLSRSQQQAFLGGFLFMLPAALLSGIMTPIRSMPAWLQPFTLLNPLRHYQEILRGALLRGAGFDELSRQLLVLAVMGALVLSFASFRFRRSLA